MGDAGGSGAGAGVAATGTGAASPAGSAHAAASSPHVAARARARTRGRTIASLASPPARRCATGGPVTASLAGIHPAVTGGPESSPKIEPTGGVGRRRAARAFFHPAGPYPSAPLPVI